jgi:branched-chain amino acid transport system substrate-binding protein
MTLFLPRLRGRSFYLNGWRLACTAFLLLVLAGCQNVPLTSRSAPTKPATPASPPVASQAEPAPSTVPTPVPEVSATGKARIALLLPLSGTNASLGQSLLNSAELALFMSNSDDLELLPRDTEGSGGAAAAASSALNDGAELILGPVFSASVADVTALARARGVPVISFSNDISVAGDGVFVAGFTPENQIDRVVSYARSRGAQRFAALVPDNQFGSRTADALQKSIGTFGGTLSRVARYTSTENEVIAPIIRRLADYDARRAALRANREALAAKNDETSKAALKRLEGVDTSGDPDFDTLLIPEGGPRLRALAPLLSLYDIDTQRVRTLGTFDWNDPLTETEPALNGGWYPTPPPDTRAQFESAYQSAFKTAAPRIASIAFDTTLLAAALVRSTPELGQKRFAIERLTQSNGFAGADGIFRLNPNGAAERGLAVIEVHLRASRIVSPAPTTFEPASN